MGLKTFDNNSDKSKYIFQRKAGKSIIERKPLFSPDGESLLLIVEDVVRVYNIKTGDCARILETENAVNELVGIQFPDNETYNLYACSDEGCVTIWTWDKGAVLREVNLQLPQYMKVLTFNLIDSNECFITAVVPGDINLHIGTYGIKNGNLMYEYKESEVFYFGMISVSLGWCSGDRFVAISNGTKYLFIQNLFHPHMRTRIINNNQFRILSVAAHHRENAVAITDSLGQAFIIRGNLYDYRKVAREPLHWHFLPTFALSFSMQGSYLYTGGMEKVLVKWTVGHLANRANEKMFIPRLPGIIRYITANDTHIAVTLSNNSVVISNPQMRVVSTILECGGLSPVTRAIGTSLVYHKSLGGLLMGGRTGHLQLYSTTTDKVLYNIDITEKNSIPPLRANLLPLELEVTCAAVCHNGTWLVTSEYRNDGVSYSEESLKFWSLQRNNTTPFKLNTCVNLSHGGCRVVSLAVNNRGDFCVSAGTDQKFRIWKRESNSQQNEINLWNCLTACYYSSGIAQFLSHGILNNFKNGEPYNPELIKQRPYLKEFHSKSDIIKKVLNIHKEHSLFDENVVNLGMKRNDDFDMGEVAISQDGSLIAAWFGCKLTLWDTHLCNLRTTLSHPALRPKGIQVQFGNHDAAHYLVCTSENCLAVWSLLSLTVKWFVQIRPTCLAADPFSNKMAVLTTNNDVYIFNPHSSTPILVKKNLLNPETGVFKQCTFAPSAKNDIRIYVMRNDSEIYCLEPEQSEKSRVEIISRRNLPTSNFSALLAEQQLSAVKPATPGALHQLNKVALWNSAIEEFLSAAPHMVPPVSLLCTSFLQHMSGHDNSETTEQPLEDKENRMEVEETSSDEEDVVITTNGSFTPKVTELWTPNYEKVKEKRLKKILKEPLLDLQMSASLFGL